MKKIYVKYLSLLLIALITLSCTKFTEVDNPENRIVGNAVFQDKATAEAAINGCYARFGAFRPNFLNGASSIYLGMYADELTTTLSSLTEYTDFVNSTLKANNPIAFSNFWRAAYEDIYQLNRCITGIQATNSLPPDVHDRLLGECYFLRAVCYWYLSNLFGDVPLALTPDYLMNNLLSRSAESDVFAQMKTDLLSARNLLKSEYPTVGKFRANKYAATSMLARLCLYQKLWQEAETYSSEVISSGAYSLPPVTAAFLANSSEAIWQITIDGTTFNTMDASNFVPMVSPLSAPFYPLTPTLIAAFEPGDLRYNNWVGSKIVRSVTYYYPYKYRSRGTLVNAKVEQPIVLRLAEQYLIRSEARANQDLLEKAVEDLKVIRTRAGLATNISPTIDRNTLIQLILQERRIELFAELGHRWFDLKRTDNLQGALSYKAGWQSTDRVFPIPRSERELNINLTQNAGY